MKRCRRPFLTITIPSSNKIRLKGWYVPGDRRLPAFLICHAYGSSKFSSLSRLNMIPKACPAILFDFRAHGESEGIYSESLVGERDDIEASLRFAKRIGLNQFIIWGRCWDSLLVANIASERSDVPGIILEGAVPNMWTAMEDRQRRVLDFPIGFFRLGFWLAQRKAIFKAFCIPFKCLKSGLADKQVILVSASYNPVERRFAKKLRKYWERSTIRDVFIPTLHHGTIMDFTEKSQSTRSLMTKSIEILVQNIVNSQNDTTGRLAIERTKTTIQQNG